MKDGYGIAKKMILDGEISPLVAELLSEEGFCETFHKLPYEVDKMDPEKYDYFCAILRGRSEYYRKQNAKK